jgi:hypothetical protein
MDLMSGVRKRRLAITPAGEIHTDLRSGSLQELLGQNELQTGVIPMHVMEKVTARVATPP